ncbi:MAG: penicillin acylase family protein, partial [Nitrospiraceae bacterium]
MTISFDEAARLLPDGDGSNNWVVDGTKTKSGKPLLAGDPHRAIDVPNVYYQNHLTSDAFDVIGASFPGVPAFSHFGHNRRVAWAVTHAGADYQDLYIERFDPNDPTRYAFQGEWRTAEVTTERIRVKDGEDVILHVRRTQH